MKGRMKHLCERFKNMDKKTKEDVEEPIYIPSLEDFYEAVRSYGNEVFDKHGAILVSQWVMGRELEAKLEQDSFDMENLLNEADLDLHQAKKDLANAQKKRVESVELGLSDDDEMEDEFGPFLEKVHSPMSTLDCKNGTLASLLIPIDTTPLHPSKVHEKHRPVVDESTFYVSKE
jgi:hypothetical protein